MGELLYLCFGFVEIGIISEEVNVVLLIGKEAIFLWVTVVASIDSVTILEVVREVLSHNGCLVIEEELLIL